MTRPPARSAAGSGDARVRARAGLSDAVALAVQRAGGSVEDEQDLLAAWARLAADRGGRQARLRHATAHPACTCADGGDQEHGERCGRCHGVLRERLNDGSPA